jgi:hypothetical protein
LSTSDVRRENASDGTPYGRRLLDRTTVRRSGTVRGRTGGARGSGRGEIDLVLVNDAGIEGRLFGLLLPRVGVGGGLGAEGVVALRLVVAVGGLLIPRTHGGGRRGAVDGDDGTGHDGGRRKLPGEELTVFTKEPDDTADALEGHGHNGRTEHDEGETDHTVSASVVAAIGRRESSVSLRMEGRRSEDVQDGDERRNATEEKDRKTEAEAEDETTGTGVGNGVLRVLSEGAVERVLDDVASLSKVLGVTRVTSLDEDLVASRAGEVELEGTVGGEEDVETATERLGEVLGKVGGGTGGERVGILRRGGGVLGSVGVGEVGGVLLLVLVEPWWINGKVSNGER